MGVGALIGKHSDDDLADLGFSNAGKSPPPTPRGLLAFIHLEFVEIGSVCTTPANNNSSSMTDTVAKQLQFSPVAFTPPGQQQTVAALFNLQQVQQRLDARPDWGSSSGGAGQTAAGSGSAGSQKGFRFKVPSDDEDDAAMGEEVDLAPSAAAAAAGTGGGSFNSASHHGQSQQQLQQLQQQQVFVFSTVPSSQPSPVESMLWEHTRKLQAYALREAGEGMCSHTEGRVGPNKGVWTEGFAGGVVCGSVCPAADTHRAFASLQHTPSQLTAASSIARPSPVVPWVLPQTASSSSCTASYTRWSSSWCSSCRRCNTRWREKG